MTATVLLSDLQALGITLQPHGDRLRFNPRDAVTPELRERLQAHKPELLRLLAEPIEPEPQAAQPIEQPREWREL